MWTDERIEELASELDSFSKAITHDEVTLPYVITDSKWQFANNVDIMASKVKLIVLGNQIERTQS